jgi:hypothetical protein
MSRPERSRTLELCSRDFLLRARSMGDPLADEAVAALARLGRLKAGLDAIAALRGVAADAGLPADARRAAQAFLAHAFTPPAWFDHRRAMAARQLPLKSALTWASFSVLPGFMRVISSPYPAAVTRSTGYIEHAGWRRNVETARFFTILFAHDRLTPGSDAHAAVVRVRLVHAGVRHWVRARGQWPETWGEPVAQLDLLADRTAFVCETIAVLRHMGVYLRRDEQADYHHLWQGVGYYLGIPEDMLSSDIEQEQAVFDAIERFREPPNADSFALRDALLNAMHGKPLPRDGMAHFTRLVMGSFIADRLRLPPLRWRWHALHALIYVVNQVKSRLVSLPGFRALNCALGYRLLDFGLDLMLKNKPAKFSIPAPSVMVEYLRRST